jgi:hypothetical protein
MWIGSQRRDLEVQCAECIAKAGSFELFALLVTPLLRLFGNRGRPLVRGFLFLPRQPRSPRWESDVPQQAKKCGFFAKKVFDMARALAIN